MLVAHLSLIYPDKKCKGKKAYFNGTGFLVQFMGRHVLMTARHNVVNADKKGKPTGERAERVEVFFGRNGREKPTPRITIDGKRFKWHPDRDVAFADLLFEFLKLPRGYGFQIGEYTKDMKDAIIEICGYPGERYRNPKSRTRTAERNTQWKVCKVTLFLETFH